MKFACVAGHVFEARPYWGTGPYTPDYCEEDTGDRMTSFCKRPIVPVDSEILAAERLGGEKAVAALVKMRRR